MVIFRMCLSIEILRVAEHCLQCWYMLQGRAEWDYSCQYHVLVALSSAANVYSGFPFLTPISHVPHFDVRLGLVQVRLQPSRPLSKRKHWIVQDIIRRARIFEAPDLSKIAAAQAAQAAASTSAPAPAPTTPPAGQTSWTRPLGRPTKIWWKWSICSLLAVKLWQCVFSTWLSSRLGILNPSQQQNDLTELAH